MFKNIRLLLVILHCLLEGCWGNLTNFDFDIVLLAFAVD